MHFAYPARKSSNPPAFAATSNRATIVNALRRIRRRSLIIVVAVILVFYILIRSFSSSPTPSAAAQPIFTKAPIGTPNVIIITTLDKKGDRAHKEALIRNRERYAKKHGYATFFPSNTDYPIGDSPSTWSKVPAVRHAMTLFPKTPFFFYIDEKSVITNIEFSVEEHITNKERLESLIIPDVPIVPPDSVIRTFEGIKGDKIDLILTQDKEGLSQGSWIVRRGEWAKFLLDAWFDPLYRSYNFQKAERHALEHIVQWHGTLLAKIALIPQNIMNSYTDKDMKMASQTGMYKEGDFMVSFPDCDEAGRSCEDEMSFWLREAERQIA